MPGVARCPLQPHHAHGGTMRTTTALLAAAALLTLTGCSSSDDSDDTPTKTPTVVPTKTPTQRPSSTPSSTPSTAALEQAVQDYTDAYFKGDTDTGYGMLSGRCKKSTPRELYAAELKQAAADYGPDHPATDVDAEVSGKLARVSYKVKGLPKLDQEQQPWTREGDAWKYDAC